ncbi:MAG: tetratricopeptide repeat protein, partial [Burkholderiaceae bacterium]|nr:tetratricopeptide repeat protein [Burkholderiaceae bacterium]
PMVVDFLPSESAARLKTYTIEEKTVVAAYLNNRAVESLVQGHMDEAYAWARAALIQDPGFGNTYVTLGVVYRLSQHPQAAEQVLERWAARDPDNLVVMSNQILVLKDLHRLDEARLLQQRLARLDPHPAGSYYSQGLTEFKAGHFEEARHWYEKEIARDPDHAEFEFALAVCLVQLNERAQALVHLHRALSLSVDASERQRYATKLARLQQAAGAAP